MKIKNAEMILIITAGKANTAVKPYKALPITPKIGPINECLSCVIERRRLH